MTIRQSGTEPIDTLQYIQRKTESKYTLRKMEIDPQKMKVFLDSLNRVNGEYCYTVLPSAAELRTIMNPSMKEILEKLPGYDINNLTPEMEADIEAGMTIGDFTAKYGDVLQPKNMGL